MGWPPRGEVGGHGGVQDNAMTDFDTREILYVLAAELAGYVVTTPEPAAVSRDVCRRSMPERNQVLALPLPARDPCWTTRLPQQGIPSCGDAPMLHLCESLW